MISKYYYYSIVFKYGRPKISDIDKFSECKNFFFENNMDIKFLSIPKKKAIESGVIGKELDSKERLLNDYFFNDFKIVSCFIKQKIFDIENSMKENLLLKQNGYSEKEYSCWCRFGQNRCDKCFEKKSDNIGILQEA